ncbi:MAG: M48 family metallopeptidase [Aquabacterium sp.]
MELFRSNATIDLPPLAHHSGSCGCAGLPRRGFTALLAAAALTGLSSAAVAQPIPECKRSGFTKLVPADQLEQAAGQQYVQMLRQADGQRALASKDHAQLQRLRYIAQRIIPFTAGCNDRSQQWRWEVNLIGSEQVNAFCMPGGKIAFYLGILAKLQLSDDEVAMIMGHEVAHALLEHARERVGKTTATRGAIELGTALLGLGNTGRLFADMGGQLLTLRFSRDDEAEADALGLVLAAKAGYDPASGVTLWRKMMEASKGAPPQWLSTHPSGDARIADIESRLPRVQPLFDAAAKPSQRFEPPQRRS